MSLRVVQLRWPGVDLAPRLAEGDALVLTASLLAREGDVERSLAACSVAERSRFHGYANAIVARRFIVGRRLVREALASVLRMAPAAVPLREGVEGKPYLAAGTPQRVWFSVSHTDDLLVLAMSRSADVGVDVERTRDFEQWQRVADRVLDAQERAQLDAAVEGGADPGAAFLTHWCRVEAELKAVGCGIHGLESHRAGARPRGLRLADLPALPIPAEIAATGARYQAAVALCAPGATYPPRAESARHVTRETIHAATPASRPPSASTA